MNPAQRRGITSALHWWFPPRLSCATLIPLHSATKASLYGPAGEQAEALAEAEGLDVFAIIQSGGRQLKVTPGSVVTVDRFDAEPGQEVTIDRVLFLEKDGGEMLAGAPFVANAKVTGVVAGEERGPKIRGTRILLR